MFQCNPRASFHRVTLPMHTLRMQVWITLHQKCIYRYLSMRVQAVRKEDYASRVEFYRWI